MHERDSLAETTASRKVQGWGFNELQLI